MEKSERMRVIKFGRGGVKRFSSSHANKECALMEVNRGSELFRCKQLYQLLCCFYYSEIFDYTLQVRIKSI